MLEELAVRLLLTSTEDEVTVGCLLVVCAGVVSGLVVGWRSRTKLYRAPYFALTSIGSLLGSLLAFTALLFSQAVAGGLFSMLAAFIIAALAALGFGYAWISLARSRDAFGRNAAVFLAFIPLANLVLLFKSSTDHAPNPVRFGPEELLSGGLGVTVGIVALVASGFLNKWSDRELDALVNAEPSDELATALLGASFRAQGLEQTLAWIVTTSELELPMQIDDVTTLTGLEAEDTVFRRVYTVDTDLTALSDSVIRELTQVICEDQWSGVLLQNGARIEEVYILPDGAEFGRYTVSEQSCSI